MVWRFMAEEGEKEEEEEGEEAVWSTESPGWGGRLRLPLPGFSWGGSWTAGRTGVKGRRGEGSERGRWWGVGGERGGERKIGIWLGQVRQEEGGERDRERATRLSGDQSIGRFSPCFFVNSSAFFKNFLRSFEYSSARSARRGCSGWGSFTSAMRDWITARHKQPRKTS